MKTLKTLLWSLLCLTFAVSCGEDPVDDGKKPTPTPSGDAVIVLDKSSVSAAIDGGDYSIGYEVQDGVPGVKVTVTPGKEWVNNIDLDTEGRIRFHVDANDTEAERSCRVVVDYRFASEPAVFTVKQKAMINAGFKLENVKADFFEYTVDIIPDDKEAYYIVMSAHPEYIYSSEFTCGEDLYEDDIAYFGWLGQFYGKSAVDVMHDRAKKDDKRNVKVSGAAPGVPYTFYCYYFDYSSGALLSEVTTFTVKTKSPVLNNVEFNMSCEVLEGCMASTDVTPIGHEGDYYFDVLPKALIDGYYLTELVDLEGKPYFTTAAEAIEFWWSNAVADMMQDMSAEQIIANYTCVGNNPDDNSPKSHYDYELLANQDYYLFAYTMEEHGLCASTPQITAFKTGDVAPSDNEIEVSVNKLTARTATFTFTPSNNDYYVAGWEKKEDWAKLGNTDADKQYKLLHTLDFELLKGEQSINILNLESDTDYVLYAFGARGGVATTSSIFTCQFRTKSGGAGSVNIEVLDLGYYDAADFAIHEGYEYLANQTGLAILPIEIVLTDAEGNPTEDHGAYFFDIYDWTGRHESEYQTDKDLMDHYVWMINEYGSIGVTHTYVPIEYDKLYEISAVVLDLDGMFSKLYRRWITTSLDEVGDADDYVAWWDAYQESIKEEDNDEVVEGDDNTETEGGAELQSLVIDNNNNALFHKKAAKSNKVSAISFAAKSVVPEVDEIVVRK